MSLFGNELGQIHDDLDLKKKYQNNQNLILYIGICRIQKEKK